MVPKVKGNLNFLFHFSTPNVSKWITFEWCLWEESIWKTQSLNLSLWSPYISLTNLWVKNLPTAVSQMTKALLYLFHHHYHSIVSKVQVMIIQTVIRFSWAHSELMCGWLFCRLDGMIHHNMKVLSPFTHPHVVLQNTKNVSVDFIHMKISWT